MKFTSEELEKLLAVNSQAGMLMRGLTYTGKLEEELFKCMKDKTELSREYIQKAHNNYLALAIIGLNYSDDELFKKLDEYMDTRYREY